ncbi:MAG: hypothetical protein JO180_03645 [Gemmatirosa sp.]|nr:hypothetical protein [Gemmatirosa sp.]
MPRPSRSRAAPRPHAVQIELFPIPLVVERLDPQRVGGARTRVTDVYLVRLRAGAAPHRVFHDRHGWYCEEHGAACDVVRPLRERLGDADAPQAAEAVRPRRRR